MNLSRQSPEASLQCLPLIRARRWLRSRSASASASLHPPCNASLRGWECGARSRSRRVLRACRRFFLWRRRRRRALGFASLAGGWQPPSPLFPPTGSQTARPFPPDHTSRLADRLAAYPPCPFGMPLATFVPSAQPRVREAASLRSAASY